MGQNVNPKEIAWNILLDTVQDDTALIRSLRLEYRMYQALKPMGPALPLALRPGDEPIIPAYLLNPGELLERVSGQVLNISA